MALLSLYFFSFWQFLERNETSVPMSLYVDKDLSTSIRNTLARMAADTQPPPTPYTPNANGAFTYVFVVTKRDFFLL